MAINNSLEVKDEKMVELVPIVGRVPLLGDAGGRFVIGGRAVAADRRSSFGGGFSLVELLIVIVILVIFLAIAVLTSSSTVANYQARSGSRGLMSMMQQARLYASNAQKPIRAVVDCRRQVASNRNEPCVARLYVAQFTTAGVLDSWLEVNGTRRNISANVDVKTSSSKVHGGSPDDLFWAVFLPSGQVRSSHDPFRLAFYTPNLNTATHWEVSVSAITGRATLRRN